MRFNSLVNAKWTRTQNAITSLILATILFLLVKFLRARGILPATTPPPPGHSGWGLTEYRDLVGLAAFVIGLLAPAAINFSRRIVNWARPRPGTRPFDDNELELLKKGFIIERGSIALATVPEHLFQAKPAFSSRSIDLGDAALIMPRSSRNLVKSFVGKPRLQKARKSFDAYIEEDILIVTGEPGAGKSVLLQEIYATLSLGIEKGQHSFVPVFIFARDITLTALEKASRTEAPMRSLIVAQYKKRAAEQPDEDLKYLSNNVKYHWDERDFIVIIDGLDEIAQRSSYEIIQRQLAQIVLRDLKTDLPRVHRYIISCRVDEDLELFHSAQSLFLRGLTDKEREKFCRALIDTKALDKHTKASLRDALKSSRLTPTHVFRRNPYFLSLLIRHIREDQDRVRTRTINFDLLMRKYLEREAVRPYSSSDDKDRQSTDHRREIFRELEGISRACLQYIAFRSASSAKTGALYDELPIDARLILGFSETLQAVDGISEKSLWSTLHRFVGLCLAPGRTESLSAESIHELGLTEHLHENDIRLIYSLARQVNDRGLDIHTIQEALGTIPYRGQLETFTWYKDLSNAFQSIIFRRANLNARQALAIIIFIRSIAAAHVLRILNVSLGPGSIGIRFRHRRLAEYYAACYVRDRWFILSDSLEFSPWLGPVMNLTCALEGLPCRALAWLVDRIPLVPAAPLFEWRYAVEAAVEASFFAQPGPAYTEALRDLIGKIVNVLSSHSQRAHRHLDAVTQIVLLRALEQLSLLETTLSSAEVLDERTRESFYRYEGNVSREWIAPLLPARSAVQILSGRSHPIRKQIGTIWKVIQQPSGVLFSRFRMSWKGLALLRFTAILSTILGEIFGLILFVALISGAFYFSTLFSEAENDVLLDAVRLVAFILSLSYTILRLLAWQQSPTRAISQAAFVWRAPAYIINEVRSLFNRRSQHRWGIAFLKVAGSFVILTGLVMPVVYLWPEKRPESPLQPCPEIDKPFRETLGRYANKIATVETFTGDTLAYIQQDIRNDIQSLREANRIRQCGYKTEEGWELAEERLADLLAKYDPRLVPSPSDKPLALSVHDIQQLEGLLTKTAPGIPEDNVIGSLATVQRSRQVDQLVNELREYRNRIVEARREGIGISVGSDPITSPNTAVAHNLRTDISLANSLDQRIGDALNNHKKVQMELKRRAKQTLVYGAVSLVALGMLLLLIRAYWRRRSDKKQLAILMRERNVAELCDILLERSYSERVRLGAMRRIDLLGVESHNDLLCVENVAGQLLSRSSETERSLGVSAATLVRTLSNRLRHRTTTDAPLKQDGRQAREMAASKRTQAKKSPIQSIRNS